MAGQILIAPDRAPRLRRIAAMIDEQAPSSRSPENARALACRLRLRATALEAGDQLSDEDEAVRLLSESFEEESE